MSIDLRTCKAGDRLKLRSGFAGEYLGDDSGSPIYPHLIRSMEDGKIDTYTHGGLFNTMGATEWDVVEIVGRA